MSMITLLEIYSNRKDCGLIITVQIQIRFYLSSHNNYLINLKSFYYYKIDALVYST